MNFSLIKSKIDEIDHTPSSAAEGDHPSFQDKALIRWREKVTEELKAILPENLDTPPIDASVMKSKLGTFLETSWNLIKGSSADYLSRPDSDITELMVLVAEQVDELNPLQALMPGVWQENAMGGYSDLNTLPIRSVLKTHVLSDSGYYLYPVRLITEINITDAPGNLPNNPYFDFMRANAAEGENAGKVTLGAYQRLEMHSPFTEAVVSAKRQYDKLSSDERHLLGQLNTLIAHLAINDAHGGRGRADSAGSGAYPAIIQFKEYYDTLPETKKAKIPHKLKQEIDKLLDLSSNKTANENATENMETCIGTRKEQLISEMKGKEVLLGKITMGEAKKNELIQSTISEFNQAHAALKAELNNSTYSGCDKPGLTLRLLDGLVVPLTFDNPTDLYRIIQGVPVTEMEELFSRQTFKDKFLAEINLIENFVIFIMETASNKLPTILTQIKNELSQTVIQSPEDLATLLISLQVEKVSIVAKSLKSDLFRFLLSNKGLKSVLKHLSPEQQMAIYEVMKDDLPTCIQSASDPVNALMRIHPEQMTALCQAMKDQWPILIQTAGDFKNIVQYLKLNTEQRTVLYEAMQEQLPKLIKTGNDFNQVLEHLNPEQRTAVYEAMKERLPTLIQQEYGFNYVLTHLNPEQITALCEAVKEKIPIIIGTGENFQNIFVSLKSEQKTTLLAILKDLWPTIIRTGTDFDDVLCFLKPEQRTAVYETIKKQLPTIIRRADDFRSVLNHLNPEQRTAVYEAMKKQLPTLIQQENGFNHVFFHLNPDQRTAVYETIKEQLPTIIRTAYDFRNALQYFNSKQKAAVYEAMKRQQLPTLIQTVEMLRAALEQLNPKQITDLCGAIENQLPAFIKTAEDFRNALQYLNPEQQKAVGKAMASFISRPKLIDWLDKADTETRQLILIVLKDELPDIILDQPSIQEIMQTGTIVALMIAFFNMTTDFIDAIHPPQIGERPDAAVQGTLNNISKYMSAEEADALQSAVQDKLKEPVGYKSRYEQSLKGNDLSDGTETSRTDNKGPAI